MEVPLREVLKLAKRAKKFDSKILLNFSPVTLVDKDFFFLFDYVIVNENEFKDILIAFKF